MRFQKISIPQRRELGIAEGWWGGGGGDVKV